MKSRRGVRWSRIEWAGVRKVNNGNQSRNVLTLFGELLALYLVDSYVSGVDPSFPKLLNYSFKNNATETLTFFSDRYTS